MSIVLHSEALRATGTATVALKLEAHLHQAGQLNIHSKKDKSTYQFDNALRRTQVCSYKHIRLHGQHTSLR